jgi:hypothetical protein
MFKLTLLLVIACCIAATYANSCAMSGASNCFPRASVDTWCAQDNVTMTGYCSVNGQCTFPPAGVTYSIRPVCNKCYSTTGLKLVGNPGATWCQDASDGCTQLVFVGMNGPYYKCIAP